jgi:hypothetical protein
MKYLLPSKFFQISSITAFFLIATTVLLAQNGAWIEQELQPTMSGTWLADRGDNCLGYTKENSQYIYFFDINNSQWTEVDLGTPQTFNDLEAAGQTVMAYTDEIIVGYSAATSQWDTLYYQGTLLYPTGTDISRGYGCGNKLAFFVTDSYFYVFDSELGVWQSHNYLYPGASVSGNFWSGDDYVGVILNQNPPNYCVNMVYSLPQHAFNENLQGGFYYHMHWGMTHGFITSWDNGVNTWILTGYSSLSNQFSQRTILPPLGYGGGGCTFPDHFVEKTVGVYIYLESISEARLVAYDTQQGSWFEASYFFDPQYTNPLSTWSYGGRVAGSSHHNIQTKLNTYLLFDGASGSYNTLSPGIIYSSGGAIPGSPIPGGNFIMAHDTSNIWFYNPANQNSHFISMPWKGVTGVYSGDNFATIGSYDTPGAPTEMHVFNATTDNITNISIGNSSIITVLGSPYMCGFVAGEGYGEVYFYSGLLDDYVNISYSPNSYAGVTVSDLLAVASDGSQPYLYDATTNTSYPASVPWSSTSIGKNVALFRKDTYTIDAYSTLSQQLTEFSVPEGVYGMNASGYIGLIYSSNYGQYYAYNGFYNNMVPLQPSGTWQGSMAGNQTALVVRFDRIYAFDPQGPTGIESVMLKPNDFHLAQNYPNPFNPTTKINYSLEQAGHVTLTIYDLLGREIETLVDEFKSIGSYDVLVDGSNLASGFYYYQLKIENKFEETKKMLLLR